MERKNNHSVKLIATVGAACLIAGILLGMLIMKAFFMPKTVVVGVPAEPTASLNRPEEIEPTEPIDDTVMPSEYDPEPAHTDDGADVSEAGTENPQMTTAKVPAWETAKEIPSEITMSFSTTYVDVDPSWPLADFQPLTDYIPDEGTYRTIIDGCAVYMTVRDVNFNIHTATNGIYNGVYVVLSQYGGTTLLAEEEGFISSMSVGSETGNGSFTLETGGVIYSDTHNFYLDQWIGPVFSQISSEINTEEEIAVDLERAVEVYGLAG